MNVSVARVDVTEHRTPLLVLKVLEGSGELVGPAARVDERMGSRITAILKRGDFRGKLCETLLLFPDPGSGLEAERGWQA